MNRYEWIDGMGSMQLTFTHAQMRACSHQGDCEVDCKAVAGEIAGQLAEYSNQAKIDVLSEFGAWDETELENEVDNDLRLVWIACCDIADDPDDYLVDAD